ncbi:iron-containing alcohol dehydrogenase [Candidatus Villigracilis proximus]|uniref:iron-containing alcohol dehydrogenase n=1 Tax=Candidatus Villigracilis proximus TaxID=3140683 RepID=UPI0031EA6475
MTYSLPPAITASSGLDALTRVIEPFVSVKANPMTDAICRAGIRYAAGPLRLAYHTGSDASAREGMALASLFGGLASGKPPHSEPCMVSPVLWAG